MVRQHARDALDRDELHARAAERWRCVQHGVGGGECVLLVGPCEIMQTAAEGRFAYASQVEGGSTTHFFIKAGATVQAIAPPTATAAECEAAVATANASGAYYPLLSTTMVNDICAASPPPAPLRSPPPSIPQPTLNSSGGGLSTGAAVGVAVGVSAAVLVGLALRHAVLPRQDAADSGKAQA